MQSDEYVLAAADVAVHQRHLFLAAILVEITYGLEVAVRRGKWCVDHTDGTGGLGVGAEYANIFCHDLVPIW
ncbi:hypothetical protein GCM10027075_16470 [Streptomyces heilongjiangensis]